ncbi:hypothetical protein L3Q82_002606 [Scortum barcoo]|uniref:Uncharacterized protein n=1 Tax=Scortum barcoo TaxID=214431 RepID=A0ACB8VUC0_9TELE|nr:hypothetical protein L3Q82_002606 [Scortum barcoo]
MPDLTLDELHVALTSLANGKAPGIDGIPVDFYKAFWMVVGEDMLEVFQESFRSGFLPLSCRRAVITLLPKKGDLQDPEELETGLFALHGDYKVLDVSGSLGIGTGLISIDQEKAFDRVEHQYMWKTLAAFGFSPAVKLSAYADDVLVVLNTQTDIKVLEENVELFNRLSSSKVNWNKSEAFVTKKDSLNGLVLPGGLSWKMGGLKYLGVFFRR